MVLSVYSMCSIYNVCCKKGKRLLVGTNHNALKFWIWHKTNNLLTISKYHLNLVYLLTTWKCIYCMCTWDYVTWILLCVTNRKKYLYDIISSEMMDLLLSQLHDVTYHDYDSYNQYHLFAWIVWYTAKNMYNYSAQLEP